MHDRKKLLELGKSLLIAVLIISALLLVRQSGYYSELSSRFQSESYLPKAGDTAESAVSGSAKPLCIVVSEGETLRYAAAFDSALLSSTFDSFSAAVGEALGSAAEPEAVSQARWRACLTGSSVTFDFYYPQDLSLLALKLGTEAAWGEGRTARLISLDCSGENALLYFIDAETGDFYRCSTGVMSSTLSAKADSYRSTNAFWAFENAKYSGLEPYTVILYETPDIFSVEAAGTGSTDFELSGIFASLDMNTYVMKQYTEHDGTQVYVESGKTLRVRSDGSIVFKQSTARSGGSLSEAAEAAFSVVKNGLSPFCGSAELALAKAESRNGGGFTICFDYCINGIPVSLGGNRHAAELIVYGGEIAQIELWPRRYTLTSDSMEVLPMIQACAIASAQGGGEIRLVYTDDADTVECGWVVD